MNRSPMSSGHILRGIQLKNLGRYVDAESAFREALSQDPHDAFVLRELALCQFHQSGRQHEALETIRRAIAIEPHEADYFTVESFILAAVKRPKEALAAARQALGCDPYSSFAFTAAAHAHSHLERWVEAERDARQALALDADNTVAANQLAQALRMQNKTQEHEAHLAALLARDPENAFTHANAGWAALQGGRRREAETHFREALRLDPDFDYAREGLLNAFRARSLFYRAFLRYGFWMQRLSTRGRWTVILGLCLIVQLAALAFTGDYKHVALAIAGVYFVLVLWVWIAKAVGNLILLFDSFARHALRYNEKIEGLMVGGGVCCGALLFAFGVAGNLLAPIVVGAALVVAAFPFSLTFTNPSRVGMWFFGLIGGAMLVASLLVLAASLTPAVSERFALEMFSLGLVSCLASTWLGSIPAMRGR